MDLASDVKIELVLPRTRDLARAAAVALGVEHTAPDTTGDPALLDESPIDRTFAFPGELATLYAVVRPAQVALASPIDREDLCEACATLELQLGVNEDGCRASAVLPCPRQPRRWAETGEESEAPLGSLRHVLESAAAVFHFQLEMPAVNALAPAELAGHVELELYCRLKSVSASTMVSKIVANMTMSQRRARDRFGFRSVLPEAQVILHHDPSGDPMSNQTLELRKRLDRAQCIAIRSRHKQVDSKCFIEVRCENTHASVCVVLKDLTLHTFTSRPVSMRVARVGRWVLPMALGPGEVQCVCFMLSDFEATEREVDPTGSANIGSIYTSIVTASWSSDVTLADVQGKHRVEWSFSCGEFDRIALRLRRREDDGDDGRAGGKQVRQGQIFTVQLEIRVRGAPGNLYVLAPRPEESEAHPVLALDAAIRVGPVSPADGPVLVPIRFLAAQTGYFDVAQDVFVYDALSDETIAVREPLHVSILDRAQAPAVAAHAHTAAPQAPTPAPTPS